MRNADGRYLVGVMEDVSITLKRARAILDEVIQPIEESYEIGSFKADFLISSLGHLALLIHAADEMFYGSIGKLNEAVGAATRERWFTVDHQGPNTMDENRSD